VGSGNFQFFSSPLTVLEISRYVYIDRRDKQSALHWYRTANFVFSATFNQSLVTQRSKMPKVFAAKVKNVLSGDTLVLSPVGGKSHQERILTLAHIQAPRLQSNEKYAFESRELLRKLLVGKPIRFWVMYEGRTGDREFGDVSSPVFSSLIQYVLEKGGARLRGNLGSGKADEEDPEMEKLRDAEALAKKEKVGMWSSDVEPIEMASRPTEAQVSRSAVRAIPAIVERVISGDRVIARLLLGGSPRQQAVIPVLIAGIKCPRTGGKDGEPSEPYADGAKFFVEDRLLGTQVGVCVLGESASGVLIAKIVHPSGNISDRLLEEGYAEIADWQSEMIGSKGMAVLRKAERSAMGAGKRLWKASKEKRQLEKDSAGVGEAKLSAGGSFSATVVRVISADTLELESKAGKSIVCQLAYLRGPRQSDEKTSAFVDAAREFVRGKVIGKKVRCTVEFVRPATDQFEERPMVTIVHHGSKNLSEEIVSAGLAYVLRRRADGSEFPEYWDRMVEQEAEAKKQHVGFYGEPPETRRVVDASESSAKAHRYLFTLEHHGRVAGIVERALSPTRFRVDVPAESVRLVLVLGGLEGHSADDRDRDSDLNKKAFALTARKTTQRDVSIEVYGVDRQGGFIGNLYLAGSSAPFQVSLLEDGFAKCHERSVAQTHHGDELLAAESAARSAQKGVWQNYDEAAEAEANLESLQQGVAALKIVKKYYDAKVSEVFADGRVAIQFLDSQRLKLKAFMQKFHAASSSWPALSANPRRGQIVASKFSQNGKYYRGKVLGRGSNPGEYQILQIDYGTIETLKLSDLKEIVGSEFSATTYKPQAHIVQLSLISFPPESQPEYRQEAQYYLEDKVLDQQVVACETFANPAAGVEMDVELYDTAAIAKDPDWSINKELVQKGWAIVKKHHLASFEKALQGERSALLKLENTARATHAGCWEYGDVEDDDN